MFQHTFNAIGTQFSFIFWDNCDEDVLIKIAHAGEMYAHSFDAQFSRFKDDSLITHMSRSAGTYEVPHELTEMLRLYMCLYTATNGKINPAVGYTLEDIGYDHAYTLSPKSSIRKTPPLFEVLKIEDATHVTLTEPVLLDLGALGKGYLVDRIYEITRSASMQRFLINGSGDIRFFDQERQPIICGLEDPHDSNQVIGTLSLASGSFCASGINRRAWRTYNHYIDPHTSTSPYEILATWVYAEEAAYADGIASALFFVNPEILCDFSFEFLILDRNMRIQKSAGFTADLFTPNSIVNSALLL
jgi:FAD:protein FMN transferase